jgi:uncharacterized membrane protein
MLARDFRENSREGLAGRWGLAIGVALLAILLGGSAENSVLSFRYDYSQHSSSYYNSTYLPNDYFYGIYSPFSQFLLTILPLLIVYCIAAFIIGGAIQLGYCRFNLNIVDREPAKLDDIFSKFDIFGKALLLRILTVIFLILWSMLFVIPGIIKCFSYAMAPYILAENPTMEANDAITESRKMMDGYKWSLFCLNFSFIGWDILSILSFGIGFLWVVPYQNAARAAFYNQISGRRAAISKAREGYANQIQQINGN